MKTTACPLPRPAESAIATAGSALAPTSTAAQLAAASITAATQRAYSGAMRRLAEHLGGAELDDKTLASCLRAKRSDT